MDEHESFPTVQGYCPMGCGESLFLGAGGYVTCRALRCPRPDAVSSLLEDRETEHLVLFDADEFTVVHPLRERLDGELCCCALHAYISALSGPPVQLGTYRALKGDGGWSFQAIPSGGDAA